MFSSVLNSNCFLQLSAFSRVLYAGLLLAALWGCIAWASNLL